MSFGGSVHGLSAPKRGRDGVGGGAMASAEFDDTIEEKRLMEATSELMGTGAVISIQDTGAAGLTCSSVKIGDKGDLGVHLNLEDVPIREDNMTAYEMMLSESQERMLMVLKPELEAVAKAVFDKWDLDFAIVVEIIAEDRFLVMHNGEIKADLPLKVLSGTAPEYDRPWVETPAAPALTDPPNVDAGEALLALTSTPNYASRTWVYEQYDTMVMADTVKRPGLDAGFVRVHGTPKALAFTSDVTPRYRKANPFEGGKQAVAKAYRNLCATGAKPLATNGNMNFGNPEKPEIMGQFVGCIKGIGDAVSALDMPIVSGNVSLYNETDGTDILPTPTIGAVGLMTTLDQMIGTAPNADDSIALLGETSGHLGQSALLKELFNREDGDAPHMDLKAEWAAGELVHALQADKAITATHDLSDGGLARAAADMALAGNIGMVLKDGDTGWFFGEDQARYLIATSTPDAVLTAAKSAGVPAEVIGTATGDALSLGASSVALSDLRNAFTTDPPKAIA